MRRIGAAWRLRSRERDHLAAALVCSMFAIVLGYVGHLAASAPGAVVGACMGLALYIWGLWDEGGRLTRGARTR